MKQEKGFTIIELLVVVFIISVLIGVGVPTYFGSLRAARLNLATNQIVSDLRKAQAKSMATGVKYGYQYVADAIDYTYIKETDVVENLETRELPDSIQIQETTFTGNKITFLRSGAASEGGQITITYGDGTTKVLNVVRITGKVKID